ncbi:MAG: WYL domain-containing protein [Prevotella sp.]|nr:WYL domain-containing protein [Prevotella sp.]
MTTPTLFKEYIWLVKTIFNAKAISLSDLNTRWVETDMSGGVEMSRTTFYRHKCAIEDMFGIYIECDRKNGNKYYIGNEEVLREDSIQNWMISTLSVSNMLGESQSLQHRILLENIPSGDGKLQLVINAMKENRQVMMTYRRYGSPASNSFTLAPYCIKLFHQRWYLLGCLSNGFWVTFSFDRMEEVKMTPTKFKLPEDFDASEYFRESYGIVVNDKVKTERIVLRAYGYEPYNLRDLPLHHTQREINKTEDYSDFELRLKPTTDFMTKLFSRGEWLEVLEPQSLAEELIEWHRKAIERYKK